MTTATLIAKQIEVAQARKNPAFRRNMRKHAIKNFFGNVAGVAVIVVAVIVMLAMAMSFLVIAAGSLVIFAIYRIVLGVITDVSHAVRGG